jgi:MoxR-like ATPase
MTSIGFSIYIGQCRVPRPASPISLPDVQSIDFTAPEGYQADEGLRDAVNVALHLGQPLLLTGEPGVGKTQLAYSLAHELGLDPPLKFETKSTSTATDLFYTYNALAQFHAALARFHAAQAGEPAGSGLQFVNYNALGKAILLANRMGDVQNVLPPDFAHHGPVRSVVLIDEVDKAPRDFPNDILNEVEQMYFRIPELHNVVVEANRSMRPILVITSNSEKSLPDAFLRRCIYYNIPFPDAKRLKAIVEARLPWAAHQRHDFLGEAIRLFEVCRLPEIGLRKRPATAELIGWLVALRRAIPEGLNRLQDRPDDVLMTLRSSLLKTREDQELAERIVNQWVSGPSKT